MNKYFAGIGSRTTPKEVLEFMERFARVLNNQGYILRSGGADGADKAFERGAGNKKEIFRPHDATPEAMEIASKVHPAWHNCKDYVRKLHGRNAQIIFGRALDKPVEFVVAWTPGGKKVGGTAVGINLAENHRIKVYNLFDNKTLLEIMERFFE